MSKKKDNLELKRTPKGEKIYRGAYEYFRGETVYSEEEFEVWKDNKELSMSYFSIMHSRVATGEILKIYVDYTVSKDYVPQRVLIERTLGKDHVTEIYDFDKKRNIIDYIFISKGKEVRHELSTNPKFHITTPTIATAMLFIKSKKEDTTQKNFYTIFQSFNNWKFESVPSAISVATLRIGLGTETIKLGDTQVQAIAYKLWRDENDLDEETEKPSIRVYLSKHVGLPYLMKSDESLQVQVKFLNDLNKD